VKEFSKKRKTIQVLVKRFRKGDEAAQAELQELLRNPEYMKVFSKIFYEPPGAKEMRLLRAKNEKTLYKSNARRPVPGGAPGLGKRG